MGKYIENVPLVDIHSAGKAVGRVNDKNIYINFGIPGEIVDINLDRKVRGFYSGNISNIQKPSPMRVQPFCKHFGTCGGCNWQHIDYSEQLLLKKQILENALKKYQIRVSVIDDVVPSEKRVYYRNKVEYAFASEGYKSGSALGFHPQDYRSQVINIEECWLQRQPSRKICEVFLKIAKKHKIPFYHYPDHSGLLRNLIIRTSTTGETLVIVGFCYEDSEMMPVFLEEISKQLPEINSLMYTILTSPEKGYADGDIISYNTSTGYLNERMGAIIYQINPKSFFQPNPDQAYNIYQKILELASFQGHELVYDLYTGAGTIACFLASQAGQIIGIEGSVDAIQDANQNASINRISNVHFICGDVLKTFTPDFVSTHGKPHIIILDPPRSGTLIEIKKTILLSLPDKIIYVSCNPLSLAFDLTMLTQGYHVVKVQPFDMFPHTHHLETLVLLERN
jgi:23S rRNA (uracil1939-C5)-methyltransferase